MYERVPGLFLFCGKTLFTWENQCRNAEVAVGVEPASILLRPFNSHLSSKRDGKCELQVKLRRNIITFPGLCKDGLQVRMNGVKEDFQVRLREEKLESGVTLNALVTQTHLSTSSFGTDGSRLVVTAIS